MDAARHLELLAVEGERVGALPPELLGADVPGLDGWTPERAVRHLGKLHQWVVALLTAPPEVDVWSVGATEVRSLPTGPDCLAAYRSHFDHMLRTLQAEDPDRPIGTFNGPATVRFWCRRQLHEVLIHRVDSQSAVAAAGGPPVDAIDPATAADGVGEWVDTFITSRLGTLLSGNDALRGNTVRLAVNDHPAAAAAGDPTGWVLRFGNDLPQLIAVEPDTGTTATSAADVTVTGPAADLLLTVWRRRRPDSLSITGDAELFHALLDAARI
jgi:uncharacterized protein (TIGR03083 family)